MITLTAKINLISGNNGTLSSVSQPQGNNISSTIPLGEKKTSQSPFIIGSSILNGSSTLSDGVDYFIGSQLSNENGSFENPYEIVVEGENISSLTIAFDEKNKKHPRSIIVDGVSHYDDDAIFTVSLTSLNSHTIKINNWNSSNSPLVITGIYVNIDIKLDKRNIKNIDCSIMQKSDSKMPSFGIISNGGSAEFVDETGEIKDYAEEKLLVDGVKVTISLNNTLANTKEVVGVFYSKDWAYDEYNKTASLSFDDGLENLQDVMVSSQDVLGEQRNLYQFMSFILSNYAKDREVIFEEDAKAILENRTSNYLGLRKSGVSVWSVLTDICNMCGICIYCARDNKIIVSLGV